MNFSNNTTSALNTTCGYSFFDQINIKFSLLVVFTIILSALGTVGNGLAILVYLQKSLRSANSIFLIGLAVFDTGVLWLTIFLYSFEVLADYAQDYDLHRFWNSYSRQVYLCSHICQVSTVYLTVAATFERFLAMLFQILRSREGPCTPFSALVCVIAASFLACALNLSRYWEVVVKEHHHCPDDFGRFSVVRGPLLRNDVYQLVYGLWLSNVLFIFLPFAILLVLNIFIIVLMTVRTGMEVKQNTLLTTPWAARIEGRIRRAKSRDASLVLFVVVTVFLVCNAPSVTLTILEQLYLKFLHDNGYLYSLARDLANVMTTLNSACNFVIYLCFGREFRNELRSLLLRQ